MFRSSVDSVESYIKGNNFTTLAQNGSFYILEHPADPSVPPYLNRSTQLVCKLSHPVLFRKGADKIAKGEVRFITDLEHNPFGGGRASSSSSWKDVCFGCWGDGFLVISPSRRRLLLLDMNDWGCDVMLDASLFLACDSSLTLKSQSSSQRFMHISGSGVLCIMTDFPTDNLIRDTLCKHDKCWTDENRAMLWSYSLDYTFRNNSTGCGIAFKGPGRLLVAPWNPNQS